MTFYSPLAFLYLLTVPVIIALYLLKQKHQEYTVSSLYLWQEAIRDIEANAPWQKLKKNILMILQILAMLLLTLALSRPFLNAAGGNSSYTIIVMDTSMSMQATDVKPSRFEAARKQAVSYVTNLRPGTLVTLVSMGTSAVIEENLSSDRNSVLEKIRNLQVTNGTANMEDASSVIQSIAKQYPGTEAVLFGDEGFDVYDVDMKFYNFSNKGSNYAITLLSHTPAKNGITVLSRIANFSPADAVVPVSLYTDGRVYDAKNVNVKAGETANIYWNSVPEGTNLIECRIDAGDDLQADNTAWDAVNHIKTSKAILVSQKNVFIEKVFSLMNGIELFKTDYSGADDLKGYDLYVYDGFLPEKLPADGNIMVFNPPENKLFSTDGEIEFPAVQKSGHKLFNYISDYSFTIAKSKRLVVPKWAEPVLESNEGVLGFTGNYENRRVLVFGFDLHNTDLPLRNAFPILMTNSMEWLIPSRIKNAENVLPGQEIEFNLNPGAEQVRVITPSGEAVNLAPPFPPGIFDKTGGIGRYTLEQKVQGDNNVYYFTVNAPAEKESNLSAGEIKAETGSNVKVNEGGKRPDTGLNLQGMLMWLILLVLTIEWWVYSYGV